MILTVIKDKSDDLALAGVAAAALCGASITKEFPGDLPCRPILVHGGALQVMCDDAKGRQARAGFVRAGFNTIELLAQPDLPLKNDPTTITMVPDNLAFLPFADVAADALCGVGLVQEDDSGVTCSLDAGGNTIRVGCDSSDVETVKAAFKRVWVFLASPAGKSSDD